MRTIASLAVLVLFCAQAASARSIPHYVFLLPDGYVGWVQVIFARPDAPKTVVKSGNLILDLDNNGVVMTQTYMEVHVGAHDEFFYKKVADKGKTYRVTVPVDFVCAESSGSDSCYDPGTGISDGFTVGRATRGKPNDGTPGSSWWLFIGPPDLRKKMAKPVHFNTSGQGHYQIDVPADDPTPGRINNDNQQ